MRTGTITLIEGVGKKSNKPYKALQLKAGKWKKMYFVESEFEMEYIADYLSGSDDEELDNFLKED